MAPVERSAVAKAKPSTIWETCFADMKWEKWDVDVKECLEVSGGCETGTTFLFHMKDGGIKAPTELANVKKNECLTFQGSMFKGTVTFKGTIVLTPQGEAETKVDYSFEISGCLGPILMIVNSKAVVGGTETGLANIVRLSEEVEAK